MYVEAFVIMSTFTVYILQNPEGKFYIGQTNDLEDRLRRHNEGRTRYTKGKGPWQLVYKEEYEIRGEAMIREKQLKKWRRSLLDTLIASVE